MSLVKIIKTIENKISLVIKLCILDKIHVRYSNEYERHVSMFGVGMAFVYVAYIIY